MESVVQICYAILAPLSVISGLILIYSFWRLDMFKHHPEILIFWQCLSQVVVDIHWFTGIDWIHHQIEGLGCRLLGGAFLYFYYLGWDYNLWLSIEILLKLLNPQNTGYNRRKIWYHSLSHGFSLAAFLIVAFSGTNGESILKTCSVENGSFLEFFMAIPIILHFPLCMWIVGYSVFISSNTFYANHLKYNMIVVGTFSFTWLPMSIIHALNFNDSRAPLPWWVIYVIVMQIAVILGASSGVLVFFARMTQRGLFKRVLLAVFSPSSMNVGVNRKKLL